MPHPFFDSVAYPWHRQDARALHRVLWQGVQQFTRIDQLYRSAGQNVPIAAGAADVVWKEALDNLATAGHLKEFCSLLQADATFGAPIRAAVQAVQDAEDPLVQTVLSGDRIFLDRRELRDKLQRLAESPSYRVLLVRGEGDSGKSWTNHLVAEVARERGETCIYLFADLTFSVEDVLDQLFTTLGGDSGPPPRMETEDAWFRRICTRLQALAQQQQITSWIIMDDLGVDDGPRVDPLVRQFFDQFALSMANPAFARWFRLVLIDYPDLRKELGGQGVPTKWRDFWEEDRTDPERVGADDIAAFVVEWARRKRKNVAQGDAVRLADQVIAAADAARAEAAAPRPRLQLIHDALLAALASL